MSPETADTVMRLAYLGMVGCAWVVAAIVRDWTQEHVHR